MSVGEDILAKVLKTDGRKIIGFQIVVSFIAVLTTFLLGISSAKQTQEISDTTKATKKIVDNIQTLENLNSALTSHISEITNESNRLARLDDSLTSHISTATDENKKIAEDVKTISQASKNVISKIEGLQRYPLFPLDIFVSYKIAISKKKYDSLLNLVSPTTQSRLPHGLDIATEDLSNSDAKILKLIFDAYIFIDFKKDKNQVGTLNNAFEPNHFWIELSMQNTPLEYVYFKSTPLGSDTFHISIGCKFIDVSFHNRSHSNVFSVEDLNGWYLSPIGRLINCDNCRFEINEMSFFSQSLGEYYPITQFSYSKEENKRQSSLIYSSMPDYKEIHVRL